MSRSGYSDDWDDSDNWQQIMAAGAYNKAVNGKRGQALLRETLEVLDAMPVKELVENELEVGGAYCVLGAVGAARGLDLATIDTENWQQMAKVFGVSETLVRQLMHENDSTSHPMSWDRLSEKETRERRWREVRRFVAGSIKQDSEGAKL